MIAFLKKKESLIIICGALIITGIFFYKTIIHQQLPFPGDLLVNMMPYKTQSFDGFTPGTYPNKAQDIDVITQLYPWKFFAISELKTGRIPLWNPHTFSGNLQLQDYQTGAFYPVNLLFFIFSFQTAWTLYIISQPFLALIFMYLFLREERVGLTGRVVGSIAFAFSSYMTVWIEYGNIGSTWLWLPLILFFIKKCISQQKLQWFIPLVLSLTIAFFAGYIQGVFYIYIIAFIYSLWLIYSSHSGLQQNKISNQNNGSYTPAKYANRSVHNKKHHKYYCILLIVLLLPIILASVQLIPTVDFFKESTRGNYSFSQIQFLLNPWYSLITLVAPDFFGNPVSRNMTVPFTYFERVMYPGMAVFFFAIFGVGVSRRKEKWLWVILGVITLLLTTNIPGIAYLYQLPIPVLSTTVPTRSLSILLFCISVLSSFGIDTWIENKQKKKWMFSISFVCLFVLVWGSIFVLPKAFPAAQLVLSVAKRNMILPTAFFLVTISIFYLRNWSLRWASTLLVVLVMIDLLFFFQKFTPFASSRFLYPTTPVMTFIQRHEGINRFWGYGEAEVAPGLQSIDDTYLPNGIDALHIKMYGDLLAASKTGNLPVDIPRMEAYVAPGYGADDLRANTYRQKLLNLLGVKYIIHRSTAPVADVQTFPQEKYRLVWQKDNWQIYENLSRLPRSFLVSEYEIIPDETNAIKRLYESSFNPATTIIVSEKPAKKIFSQATGTANVEMYTPQKVVVKTQTTGSMMLFLSDTYSPDWHAQIDGKLTPLYVADTSFRAVNIPGGKHTVTFFYASQAFNVGLMLSFIGCLLCVIGSVYFYMYAKKK